jgi:hypothetical protein
LLIVWPRFILLIAYINMLWLYYLLACDEERRMSARYGELYIQQKMRTSMFLLGEPGGQLNRLLFGWIGNRRVRLLAVYALSVLVTVGVAFLLRDLTLELTTHFSTPDRRIAAISFGAVDERELHRLLESADNAHVRPLAGLVLHPGAITRNIAEPRMANLRLIELIFRGLAQTTDLYPRLRALADLSMACWKHRCWEPPRFGLSECS